MHLSRRACLRWGASAAATSWLAACATRTPTESAHSGFVHHYLGSARITALSDGAGRRPVQEGFVKNASLAQVQGALQAAGLPTEHMDIPYTCYVIELGGKRYLVDTGFADNGPAGTGLLQQHLQAAQIAPESIDAVIISHMHGDHIQGLRRKDGSLVYPKATVYVPQPEAAFWLDDARMQAAPEGARGGFQTARRVFGGYPAAQLQTFEPGTALAPGLQTIAAFGHSPGHTALRVSSQGEHFTFLADTTNLPALFVTHPDWVVQFDMNPEQARATRHALLRQLAQTGEWVGGYHYPLPGVGRIHTQGAGYRWQPR